MLILSRPGFERVVISDASAFAARSQAQDYKFRLEQATQKITALEGDIIRLESQVKRYKTNLDDAEKKEEQLKQDRRKLQRDVSILFLCVCVCVLACLRAYLSL
ncbi:unnamed protein product [Dibothriocephalus latus]|uniref:Uncharacterized protein n=1 Tax=Dibothriocephalus latus TaxID=60516 RepID=A0A3P7LKI5_DIBLA|nr:unnamed protein product [Dibothriocephalus latus]